MAELPIRKYNRLSHHDYSTSGKYFVTICTDNRKNVLSDIVGDGSPVPKHAGKIAEDYICEINRKYPDVFVDRYVIMPNHIHMILTLTESGGTENPSPTLGNVIGWYKYSVTKQINAESKRAGNKFFQRSYFDRVIRDEAEYQAICYYIETNPVKWKEDRLFNG